MSVTLGKSPIILTAQGDAIGSATTTGMGQNWKVTEIAFIAGGAGSFILKDTNGGRVIAQSGTMSAGERESVAFYHWIDGMYVDTIPSNSQIHVYYE